MGAAGIGCPFPGSRGRAGPSAGKHVHDWKGQRFAAAGMHVHSHARPSTGAELVLDGNRFVSTRHCLLQRDEEGRKWLTDSSTNGTLLNNRKLQKDNKVREIEMADLTPIAFPHLAVSPGHFC